MQQFSYQAFDNQGKKVKGKLEAESIKRARQQLRDKKLTIVEVKPASAHFINQIVSHGRQRIKINDLALITRQMATLLAAALPLEEVLLTVARQSDNKQISSLISQIRAKVLEGFSLAQTLAQYPKIFDRLFCSMVSAGEATGQLPEILGQLADYVEQRQKLKNKMTQALVYPVALTVVAIGVVCLLMTAVVPKVVDQFIHMKQTLPITTRLLIACSHWLKQWGALVLVCLVVGLLVFQQLLRNQLIRLKWHKKVLRLPLLGNLLLTINTSRYAHTLSILCSSAVPLLESMKISATVLNNDYAREQLLVATEKVREGESLNQSLANTQLFSPMMNHMIASGERSGDLAAMLQRAARMQQEALEQRTSIVLSLFEPLLVVSMAGIVLFIILAILQPILQLNNIIQ